MKLNYKQKKVSPQYLDNFFFIFSTLIFLQENSIRKIMRIIEILRGKNLVFGN